jgi:hypothetical protein
MYVNAKTIPVETVPEIGGVQMKESMEGMNANMIYLKHCKNLCKSKCHYVFPPRTTIKENKITIHTKKLSRETSM